MWLYTCMVLIFYSTPAVFFCDATMYIYMKIQLHLSHTTVECENKFLNVAWQCCRPPGLGSEHIRG